jgi:lipoate-protein ligase A
VFHEDTISFAHAVADTEARARVTERFEATAGLVARAFAALGIDARVGEVEGEYCPGEHSVNALGERKLMGVGQRIVKGGVHVGGVVVVAGAELVNRPLVPVYAALGLDWRPDATGSLEAYSPGVSWDDAVEVIRAEYAALYDLAPAPLDDETLTLARRLAPEHESPNGN